MDEYFVVEQVQKVELSPFALPEYCAVKNKRGDYDSLL